MNVIKHSSWLYFPSLGSYLTHFVLKILCKSVFIASWKIPFCNFPMLCWKIAMCPPTVSAYLPSDHCSNNALWSKQLHNSDSSEFYVFHCTNENFTSIHCFPSIWQWKTSISCLPIWTPCTWRQSTFPQNQLQSWNWMDRCFSLLLLTWESCATRPLQLWQLIPS